jgi:replicative DNA helicase
MGKVDYSMKDKKSFGNALDDTMRTMPYDVDTERAVLGACMIDNEIACTVAAELTDTHFYAPRNKLIYVAITALVAKREIVEAQSVIAALTSAGELESAGGSAIVMQYEILAISKHSLPYYIGILRDKAARRELIRAGSIVTELGADQETPLDDLLGTAEQAIGDVKRQHDGSMKPSKTLAHMAMEIMADIENIMNGGAVPGLLTGLYGLDEKLCGLNPSDLIIVAARPAMGKTAFVTTIALNAALSGKRVAFFSLEMPQKQIVLRLLSMLAKIPLQEIRSAKFEGNPWKYITAALDQISSIDRSFQIFDTAAITVNHVRSKCRQMAMNGGLDLVVVDYLQLMRSPSTKKNDNREREVAEISGGLKAIAKEFNVPVIALSQLNRGLEQRQDKRPNLSDLRESGSIEQDADIVMMLYRDEYYYPQNNDKHNIAEVIIAKNRNGATYSVDMRFDGRFAIFENLATQGGGSWG